MIYLSIWDRIKDFFIGIHEKVNGFLQRTFAFDEKLIGLYEEFIQPIPEIIKICGAIFVAIILVLGVISFVKKMFKLFIILAIIFVIILLVTRYT